MNQAMRIPAGKKLVALSRLDIARAEPGQPALPRGGAPDAQITIGRVTLNVSVLKKAVSR